MKLSFKPFPCLILLLLLIINSNAQKLSLNDLHLMSSNKNWETSNKFLLSKGWEYYDSSVGDDEHYNKISWSYEKSYSDDKKANGWVYIYSYDGLPNKVLYRFRKKEYYTIIKNSLTASGYKLDDEEILDQRVIAKYSNANYILELTYSREEDQDDYSGPASFTAYEITVYKKGGVYDPNNGKKQEFDENGNLAVEYSLKNGKAEGIIKFYNPNGTLSRVSFMKAGNENGISTQYFYDDSDTSNLIAIGKYKGEFINGNKNGKWLLSLIKDGIESELSYENYSNGLKNGPYTKVSTDSLIVSHYKNDKLNGPYTIYRDFKKMLVGGVINTDTLKLKKITDGFYKEDKSTGHWKIYSLSNLLIEEGNYVDSLQTGKWKYYYDTYIDDNDKVLEYSGKLYFEATYSEGKKNGPAIRYSFLNEIEEPCADDSTKTCTKKVFTKIHESSTFKDGLLDGPYELLNENNELLCRGQYQYGKETGNWIRKNTSPVDFWTGKSIEKGRYLSGEKQGKWERFNDENRLIESYNYKDDILDGEQITYLTDYPRVKREFKKGELDKFTILDSIGNTIKSFQLLNKTSEGYRCVSKKHIGNSVVTYSYKVKLFDGEEIIPTVFSKTFEELPNEKKIFDGAYELTVDGKINEKGQYENNNRAGIWNYFFYDQGIQLDIDYGYLGNVESEYYYDLKKQEPFSGEFIYKHESTDVAEERKVKDGKRNGTTRYKDASDKTIKKESYKDGILKE